MATAPPTAAAALQVPILPHTSPEATPPEGLRIPLYPHQLRALHRCQVIESLINSDENEDNFLGNHFNAHYHYKARGGVLADEVGTGKTATSIGLVMSDAVNDDEDVGDTLVVAPKHLIPQWKQEVERFASSDHLQVVVGKAEYERTYGTSAKRRIVLVDVDTILNEQKLWYDWRQVYTNKGGACLTKKIGPTKMKLYKEAALFSVKSAKGPCSYEGWVYTGSLHLPQRPWRRVIYDEIQDLVQEGRESQKNLLQLTRTAQNVWLLSATPFPHGNASVYANHELLGFCRLRMDVESFTTKLPASHPFEQIKRKLYIKSPRHVADTAKVVTVVRNTKYVAPLELEKRFYKLEWEQQQSLGGISNLFGERMNALRQMTVHPEASAELRQVFLGNSTNRNTKGGNTYQRPVSNSVQGAAQKSILNDKRRLSALQQQPATMVQHQLQSIAKSIALVMKVQAFRQSTPLRVSVFAATGATEETRVSNAALVYARQQKERQCIHDSFCVCKNPGSEACFANKRIFFRKIGAADVNPGLQLHQEFITGGHSGALDELVQYFQNDLAEDRQVPCGQGTVPAMSIYLTITRRVLQQRKDAWASTQEEIRRLKLRIDTLSEAPTATTTAALESEQEQLAQRHGSKPAALVTFLQSLQQEDSNVQVIVFSYWHDTLKLVQRTLRQCALNCAFLESRSPQALTQFTSGQVPILLLSAKSQASGANLQCATHVILMDPAGSSGEHGSTLEEQAIGRAARMGQTKPVTVTRFCVVGTVEEGMFNAIDQAEKAKAKKAKDSSYVIVNSDMEAPVPQKRAKQNPDNDVQVTAAITQAERLEQSFQQAKQKGVVIDLLDGDEDSVNDAVPISQPPTKKTCFQSQQQSQVKREPPSAALINDLNLKGRKEDKENSSPQNPAPAIPIDMAQAVTNSAHKRSFDASFGGTTNNGSNEESDRSKRARKRGTPALKEPVVDATTNTITPHKSRASAAASTSTPLAREMSLEDVVTPPESVARSPSLSQDDKTELSVFLKSHDLMDYEAKVYDQGRMFTWMQEHADNFEVMETLVNDIGFTAGHAIRFQAALLNGNLLQAKDNASNKRFELV